MALPAVLLATIPIAVPVLLLFPGAAAQCQVAIRQSFDLAVPFPPTPLPIEGTAWLYYELHLTNFAETSLSVELVEVVDGEAAVLARIDDGRTIPPAQRAVLYLEVPMTGAPPPRLEHRVHYRSPGEIKSDVVVGGTTSVVTAPPVVLDPPLRGGPWAAVHHPSWDRGHRRVLYALGGRVRIPGRYAIDWILLDRDGRATHGDRDTVANWLGQGAPVLAVADGVVVAVRDDVAESTTLSGHPRHPLADATGNYVALRIGEERFAFYEHLAPGSITVSEGQRVRRGQVIGRLGFTGHSTGPHLHFHLAHANSPLGAEGVPFVLDAFTVLGRYDDIAGLGRSPWGAANAMGERRRERPAPNAVVMFPRR